MIDGDFESINCGQNAAAEIFESPGEVPDLTSRGREKHIESTAERGIIGSQRRQNARMVD